MNTPSGPRRGGRFLRVVGVIVMLLVVFALLAPSLVSWTIGRGIVGGAVGSAVNGAVTVDRVRFGWTAPQEIEGLRIDDRAGGNTVVATVALDRSLLSLITDPMGELEIEARADITTKQSADGTIGLASLVKPSTSPSTPSQPATAIPRALVVALKLDVSSLSIDRGADGVTSLTNLAGTVRFAAADGSVKADLKGKLGSGATLSAASGAAPGAGAGAPGGASSASPPGAVSVSADLRHVIDSTGAPTIGAIIGTAKVTADAIAMSYQGATSSLRKLEVDLDATDAAKPITVGFTVDGAQRELIEVSDLAGRASLGRDPKGPLGLSATALSAAIDRGAVVVRNGAEPFSASNLKADISVGAGGRAAFTLAADTAIGERRGSVAGEGALEHLFNDAFEPTLAATTGTAKVTVNRAVLPVGELLTEIEEFVASIDASNVNTPIQVNMNGRGVLRHVTVVPGATGAAPASPAAPAAPVADQPTSLVASATLARDPASKFGISTDPRTFSASVDARTIPSAALRALFPIIDEFGIEPNRDFGPTFTLNAKATAGASVPLELTLQSQRLNADMSVTVDPETGSVRDGRGKITATIAPELLAKTPVRSAAPLGAVITLTSFSLPRRNGEPFVDDAAGDAAVEVTGAFTLATGDTDRVSIDGLSATLHSKRVADGITASVRSAVDGVPTQLASTITGVKALGQPAFSIDTISAKGSLTAGPVDWLQPPQMLREIAPKVPGFGLVKSTATVEFDGGMSTGTAQATVTDGAQKIATTVEWTKERVKTSSTSVAATLTDKVLDGIGLTSFRLAQPAPILVTVEPVELARTELERGEVKLPELKIGVSAKSLVFTQVPGVPHALSLTDLNTTISLQLDQDVATALRGTVGVREGAGNPTTPIATIGFGFNGTQLAVPARQWSATVDSKDLEATRLMGLAGIEPDVVPGIAPGDRGTVTMKIATEPAGAMGVEFDSAIGATRGVGKASLSADGAVSVPTADLSITLDAAKSSSYFAQEKDVQGRTLITRASAVPITLSVRDAGIPAPNADGSRSLARSKGTATLTTGNLDLDIDRIGTARIGAVDAKIVMLGDGRGLDLRTNSTLTTPQAGTHPLALQMAMTNFADAKGDFDWVHMSLSGNAKMLGLPSALLDLFVEGDGVVVDAIGPQVDVSITAVSPSGNPGSVIAGTVKSEFLAVDLGNIAIENNAISVAPRAPVKAELIPNEVLRQRLLKPINPIFADIRPQAGKPITFTVDSFALPTDFELSNLSSKFVLTIGDVELQRRNSILSLMKLVREDEDGIIPGNISPLNGTITDGRLSYDSFTLSIGKIGETWNQQIFLSGDVDIGSKPMFVNAINVDYPLSGIGRLAAGATRFDAFFGRVSQVLSRLPLGDSNLLRVRATFSGPIEPDRELQMVMEPVLISPPGSNPVDQLLDGIFGDKGILKLPGLGGSGSSGSGGTGGGAPSGGAPGSGGGTGGGTTPPPTQPKDPIRGILDDLFKKKK